MSGQARPAPACAIEAAAAMLAADPDGAEARARAILAVSPGDPRARLVLASALRRRGDAAGALALLEPLGRAYPRAANTQYELGAARAALDDRAGAIAALRQAVALNREIPLAWRTLGDVLFKAGDMKGADAAYAEHQRACVQDPALKAAADALAQDRPAEAEARLRAHLSSRPPDPVALQMLGEALGRLDRLAEAQAVLEQSLRLDPGFDGARFTYATLLFQQQKAAEAAPHVRRLLAASPRDPAYRNLLAACLSLVGDLDEVDQLYRELLAEYPLQPRLWLNHGHALRTVGRLEAAVAAFRRCLALAPDMADAYWGLANLKVADLSDAEVQAMGDLLAQGGLRELDRLHLHFALGKALEDRGAYARSFEAYSAGAALRRRGSNYSADRTTEDRRRAEAVFTRGFFAARQGAGAAAEDPIFVVGLPRSGSTLVEQILASHPDVEGTMELPDIGLIARRLADQAPGGDYLEVVATRAVDFDALGRSYLAATQVHRKLGRRRFIDKMPNNFRHIGLIQLILPNARILDVRRHPLGACFSAFKQHFAQGQGFSYDLDDLGRYYRDYVALMAHYHRVLPVRVHRVIYEDLVEDTETAVRRLLDHCGLPFEPACLRFYDNDRAVKTVSSEQVRRPIFRDGLEQWRRFEPWLDPLKAALGPALEDWRG